MYHFDTLADPLSAHRVLQLAVPLLELAILGSIQILTIEPPLNPENSPKIIDAKV
jgi:hypothetical protein